MDRFPGGKSHSRSFVAERARRQEVIRRIATENARDERARGIRTENDVKVAEQFLSPASQYSREAARIMGETLRRQKLEKAVGTRLYRKWENALERAIVQIREDILQAELGRKLAVASAMAPGTNIMIHQYKERVRKIVSQLNKRLAAKIIKKLKDDHRLRTVFRGRSGLLRRLFYNLKSQAARNTESIVGYLPYALELGHRK